MFFVNFKKLISLFHQFTQQDRAYVDGETSAWCFILAICNMRSKSIHSVQYSFSLSLIRWQRMSRTLYAWRHLWRSYSAFSSHQQIRSRPRWFNPVYGTSITSWLAACT